MRYARLVGDNPRSAAEPNISARLELLVTGCFYAGSMDLNSSEPCAGPGAASQTGAGSLSGETGHTEPLHVASVDRSEEIKDATLHGPP